jgi:hypothetical protein
MKRILSFSLGLALGAGILFAAPTGGATSIEYFVDVNTASLAGNASGPFSLDFQLNDGSGAGDGNNTATINNFAFGSGGASGTANLSGGASGDLSSVVSLTDTSAFNEFYQTFNAGSTLSFDVTLTLNSDSGPAPDAFVFAILDNTLSNISTSGVGDSYLLVNLGPTPGVVIGSSASPAVTLSATPVPEPGSLTWISLGLLALGLHQWRHMGKQRG